MAVERRTLWLVGLLGVTTAGALIVYSMDGAEPGVAPGAARPRAATRAAAAPAQTVGDVSLDTLTRAREAPTVGDRNPFRFRPKPAPPPPPNPQSRPGGLGLPAPTGVPQPARAPGPPPPPPITLKFIGFLGMRDGTKIAVLSDGRRTIHGVEGQEVEGQYRILKIGNESLEISYLDGRGRQTIKLTGQ